MSDRFIVSADGQTVHDSKTGLTWQRAVPDQRMTWAEAKEYAAALDLDGGGWRLPTVQELVGIVDYCRRNPAIDEAAFPDTPLEWFWTNVPVAGDAGGAWYVGFDYGYVYDYDVGYRSRVRYCR